MLRLKQQGGDKKYETTLCIKHATIYLQSDV